MADRQKKDSVAMARIGIIASLLWLVVAVLAGCGNSEESTRILPPVAIEAGDECHVCGMIITNFSGPKGEAFLRTGARPLKFCSTRDLFSYLLQPESRAMVTQVYVHGMGASDWAHPTDSTFIDARMAWYVADQPMRGAMGPTLAAFKGQEQARAFIEQHGGRLLRFEEITLEILANLGEGASSPPHP